MTNNNIKIVRLQSGEDIIANYMEDEENDTVLLDKPMHVILKRLPNGRSVMMMILLLFLQKQNLAFGVYLFGSVLSFKRDDGPGAEPDDGEEVCPGGNARPRWRSADAQVGAGSGGGAVGKRDIHTPSISVQNGEDGRQSRGRRRRSECPGRDDWHAGRGNTATAATDTGSHGRGGGGRRSNIDNCTSLRDHGRQNHQARQAPDSRDTA